MHRLALLPILAFASTCVAASQTLIKGPAGSVSFGESVRALGGGRFAVVDAGFDGSRGVVRFYGSDGREIGSVRGSSPGDFEYVDLQEFPSGNLLVCTPRWDAPGAGDAGAVTRLVVGADTRLVISETASMVGRSAGDRVCGSALLGVGGRFIVHSAGYRVSDTAGAAGALTVVADVPLAGQITPANSLVGSRPGDLDVVLRDPKVLSLDDGRVVLALPGWDRGSVADAGAVIVLPAAGEPAGPIDESNAIVGLSANDGVGISLVPVLDGFAIVSARLDIPPLQDAGAVTWIVGDAPTTGDLPLDRALVGASDFDHVGIDGVFPEPGGTGAIVLSPAWNSSTLGKSRVGAATWVEDVRSGRRTVSEANSIIGSSDGDLVGASAGRYSRRLDNGTFALVSHYWDGESAVDAGAVTLLGSPAAWQGTGVSRQNSLVGEGAGDGSSIALQDLAGPGAVISCARCDHAGMPDVGAVRWVGGLETGNLGDDALTGAAAGDMVELGVRPLGDGSYFVVSSFSDANGEDAGAIAWVDASGRVAGGAREAVMNLANSFAGSAPGDRLGGGASRALENGLWVLTPRFAAGKGAITVLPPGSAGGVLGAANSLIGRRPGDFDRANMEFNRGGDILIGLPAFDTDGAQDAGMVLAATRIGFPAGEISPGSGLVGEVAQMALGSDLRRHGDFFGVRSETWPNAGVEAAGFVFAFAGTSLPRAISPNNAVLGQTPFEADAWDIDDTVHLGESGSPTLYIGSGPRNLVVIYRPSLFADGFD